MIHIFYMNLEMSYSKQFFVLTITKLNRFILNTIRYNVLLPRQIMSWI